jgi:hypothetical protein
MFETNDLNLKEIGNEVFLMDDFYKNPREVLDFIENTEPIIWKHWECPSYNMIHFEDLRHEIPALDLKPAYYSLSSFCGQQPCAHAYGKVKEPLSLSTNITRFKNDNKIAEEFNDYRKKYWWPHRDDGWNGLVYFSEGAGTNLYNPSFSGRRDFPEHYKPWIDKEELEVVYSLESKVNRLVFFNGKKYPHGMDIIDDTFFGPAYRINQAFFFQQ